MSTLSFISYEQLTAHVRTRPAQYLFDFERIIAKRDAKGVYYDTSLPAYREMLRKYRPAPRNGHRAGRRPRRSEGSHWQVWREEDGRWVAEGWLRPGFYADSPGFDPLPSEMIRTPAFPAADFVAPVSTDPVDIVIPLGTGSKHDDAELRYALRSIERHVENLGRVWVVGHRPAWLQNVEHIEASDPSRSKDRNILAKIELACRAGVSERFAKWSDDQILLRPLAWSQLGPFCWGDLVGRTDNGKGWNRRLLATRDWLVARGLSTLHCDTHTPIPIERAKFLDLAVASRDCWTRGDGVTVGTWYANQAGKPRPMGERKATITAALPSPELRAALAGRWFVGHNDPGFSGDLRGFLDELFPEPSRFEVDAENDCCDICGREFIAGFYPLGGQRFACSYGCAAKAAREPTIRVKSAGPTLSVIVPTIGRPTLKRTLESIARQDLVDGDEVIVVQDGPEDESTRRVFEKSGLPGRYMATGKRANDFGATPRNLGMAEAKGDYLLFMDDDDTYTPGAFAAIRKAIARHPGRPLMFRMERPGWAATIWRMQAVVFGNVSTQMFIVPNTPEKLGTWPSHRASDFGFITTTLRKWPPGSLLWEPMVIASVTQAGGPTTMPMMRNLVYHVYAPAGNDEWRLNVERLTRSWDLFNGRRIVGIVTDKDTVPVSTVQAAFPDKSIEWLIRPNDTTHGETVTFLPAMQMLESLDPDETTFYGHTKGTSPRYQPGGKGPEKLASIRRWRNFMYRACLEEFRGDRLDMATREHAAAGCLRSFRPGPVERDRPPWYWQFSGTFFWLNHARFFSHPDALKLGRSRWALERHLGELFSGEETCCLAGDHIEEFLHVPGVYKATTAEWDVFEAQAGLTPELEK